MNAASVLNLGHAGLCDVSECVQVVHGAGRVHRNMSPESILLMVQSQHWRIASFTASALMGALLRQLVWHRAAHARAVLLKLCHTACLIKDVRDMTQC